MAVNEAYPVAKIIYSLWFLNFPRVLNVEDCIDTVHHIRFSPAFSISELYRK